MAEGHAATMTGFSIEELAIPASIDARGAADFIEMTRVRNEIEAASAGNYDLAVKPEELLPVWLAQEYEAKRMLVARAEGRIVGRGIIETNRQPSSPTAWITVELLPDFRRRGIGAALYSGVERMAIEQGKSVLQTFAIQGPDATIDRMVAPTGYGSVPRDSDVTRFLLARGFTLEQVSRMSRLPLPLDRNTLQRLLATADHSAVTDYRTVFWTGRTPEDRLAQVAELRARMATDAPQANLEPDDSPWTPERVRADDDVLAASPRTKLTALVEHVPTGSAAGYTELDVPAEATRPVTQEDTIVVREHRGHRLGMLLKAANLLRLDELMPGHPSVITFNAEENRHMLSVNEELGFVPWGYEGAWKKVFER